MSKREKRVLHPLRHLNSQQAQAFIQLAPDDAGQCKKKPFFDRIGFHDNAMFVIKEVKGLGQAKEIFGYSGGFGSLNR